MLEIGILTDEISLNLDEALAEGKALGFRKYELRCVDSYEQRVPNLPAGTEERLKAEIDAGELELTALAPGLFKLTLSDREAIETELADTLPRTCKMAQRLNVPNIVVFSFMRSGEGLEAEAIDELRKAGQIVADHGLKMAIENEPGFYADTGENTAALVKAIGLENVGINWDPGNAVSSGEAAYPIGYRAVLPYLFNVHVKDTIPIPPDKWENLLIGDGGVNWLGQIQALRNDRPIEHITLETHVFPLLESTREDLRRLRILLDTVERLDEVYT
jgi:sugar phosphate isomerase/epimerase